MKLKKGQERKAMENFIKQLSQLNHRLSGTRENEQGTQLIRGIFNSFGWTSCFETFHVPGSFAYGIVVNIVALLAIYFFLQNHYAVSLVLYGIALISLWGELTVSFHLLRRLHPTHKTRNIEARLDNEDDSQPLVILTAHHDTPRSGIIYHEKVAGRFAPVMIKLPPPFNRMLFPTFCAALLLGTTLTFRPVTAASLMVPIVSILSNVILGLTLFLVLQWGFSTPSPGANDNGSGVLVLLELARRFSTHKPSNVSVRLLATGAEETGLFGIKAYLRRHKKELQKRNTLFINVETVGGGDLYWVDCEEFLGKVKYPKEGFDLLAQLEQQGVLPALPRVSLIAPTDGTTLVRAGFRILTLVGLENQSIPTHYHRVTDTFDKLDRQNLLKAADIIDSTARGAS